MGIITDVKYQKNDKRVNLYLDNRFFCGLQTETFVKNNLKIGQEIESQKIEKIQIESEQNKAFDAALRLLDRKQYSEKEIAKKLKEKGYLGQVIYLVIEKLKEYKYINDSIYVKNFIKSYTTKSKKEIVYKLKNKGIKDSIIENEICEISDDVEFERAKRLCEKYIKNKEITIENKQKTLKYIISKGFEYDMTKLVVNICFEEKSFYD